MTIHHIRTALRRLLWLALLAAACLRTPPAQLYLLSAADTAPLATACGAPRVSSVGLGPVGLPDYLDRPQIVTRSADHRLEASDGHRWAEPLAGSVTRVLQEDLAALLAPVAVVSHPWKRAQTPPLQVQVDVLRFEAGPDPALHLNALWSISRADGTVAAGARRSEIHLDAELADFEARAAAASRALLQLSREIAAELIARHLPLE